MDKTELLNILNKKYDKGLDNKANAEKTALININFINGKQYLTYDPLTKLFKEINNYEERDYREKEVFNRIRSLRNTVLTKVKDKLPIPFAVPMTQDDSDVDAAKATSAVLEDLFKRQNMINKMKKVYTDMVDIGPAFIHVRWNPDAGQVLMSDVDKMIGDLSALIPDEEKEALRKKLSKDGTLRSGDVELEFLKMFELIPGDPYEQDIQEQPWIMRVKAYQKEEAEKLFGVKFAETEVIGRITATQDRTSDNKAIIDNLGVYNSEEVEDAVVIKEYFEKPSPLHPNGRRILFCKEKILQEADLPYINGEYETRTYPFIKFGLDTPNLFYSHAFIEDMKSVQKRYNQIRNRKFEHITKSVHGQLMIQDGALEDDTKITNRPGEIIWYKRGYNPPTTINTTNTGALDAESELRSLGEEFVKVTGVSTLSTNGAPNSSAVRGANMVQMLMEADDSKFSLIVEEMSLGVVAIAKQVIRLYKQFMMPGEVRFTRFTKNLTTTINWKSDLLTEEIEIRNKSKLTLSDARRKENMQMLMQSGLLSADTGLSPELRIKMIEEMDLGIPVNEMPFEGIGDVKKARRENAKIVNQGAQIDADPYDDHQIHFAVHSDYIKSDEYLATVTRNPQVDELFRAHVDQHFKIVEAQREKAMAEAAAQQNKGGK